MKRPAPLRLLWAQHRPTVLLTAGALVVALFFGARFVIHAAHWQDLRGGRPTPQPWMTLRYVATAWQVPPDQIRAALDAADAPRRQSLEDLAQAQGRPLDAVMTDLNGFLLTLPPPAPQR